MRPSEDQISKWHTNSQCHYVFLLLLPQDAAKLQKAKAASSTPVSSKASSLSSPHYKLNFRPVGKLKPKSLSSPACQQDKAQLFEDLEDSTGTGETFVPRVSVKKLVMKPKARTHPSPHSPSYSQNHPLSPIHVAPPPPPNQFIL